MINNILLNKSNFEKLPEICVIKNGTIVDPFKEKEYLSDIKIVDGVITEINESIAPDPDNHVIDAKDKYISPGFMDMHVHLREPGYEQAETFITGSNAAMSGGFTRIATMPNTSPCVDNIFVYNDICRRTEDLLVKIHQIPAVTIGREGKALVEMAELNDNGALAFSDDGDGLQDGGVLIQSVTPGRSHLALDEKVFFRGYNHGVSAEQQGVGLRVIATVKIFSAHCEIFVHDT